MQPDPFGGVSTRPASLNAYPYAYDNPLIYTDPSGRNPVLVLAAGILGGLAPGMAAGGVFGALTYDWARAEECGCEMQQRALSMTRWEWIGANALSGGILGLVATVIAAIGPLGLIVVGGAGVVLSVADFVNTVQIMVNETGPTLCTALRLLIDVVVFALGRATFVKGVTAWQASGRLLSLRLSPPLAPTFGERVLTDGRLVRGDFPEVAGANEILYRAGHDGAITAYEVYNPAGEPLFRVDLVGRAHGGIPTPHVVLFERNIAPDGTVFIKPSRNVIPAAPDLIP